MPGAAEAGGDLVADQQDAVRVAQLAHRAQVAVGLHQHPRRALDERLDDHRGDLVAVLGEDAARRSVDVAGRGRSASNSSGR